MIRPRRRATLDAVTAPPALLPAGTVVGGDFVVEGPRGEGGMGAVFVAMQTSTGKRRALKLMHRELLRDPVFVKRFEQEAKVGARIASDHVVETVAAGVDAAVGLPYLVMELLEGEDLRTRIDRAGALPIADAAEILEQLAHGLGAAHAAGIVHRDLKPENVFLARARRAGASAVTVKLLDFGIARLAAEAATRSTRSTVGSPLWMAPEQTQPGAITPAADVWALGLLAYEMLTGRHFWRSANDGTATTAQLLREVVLDPIPTASARAAEQGALPRVPPGFDAWLARCLAREPASRFRDASVAWDALSTVLGPTDGRTHARQRVALGDTVDVASEPADPAATGDASRVVVPASAPPPTPAPSAPPFQAVSAPPFQAAPPYAPHGIPSETPVNVSHRTGNVSPLDPGLRGSRSGVAVGLGAFGGLAVAGLAIAFALSRRSPEPAVKAPAPADVPSARPAIVIPETSASGPSTAIASATAAPAATATAVPPTIATTATTARPSSAPSASASAKPPAPRTVGGGFADPVDRGGPVTWKVQGRPVRLLTRLVSNESNVVDPVVRKAVEWSSWQYLRCYERAFSASKDMPEGVVTVGFDILDQLPRHAAVASSTIGNDAFDKCVVNTLIGQTINAAGPDGRGHVVVAFKFLPN